MIVALLFVALPSCSEDGVSVDAASLSDDGRICLSAANSMIDVARQAVSDTNSRPERRETRRVLMEDWISRLNSGEDPCLVYEDIGVSATTF